MGYSTARFVANIDQNLLCSICSYVLQDAVLTPCGHSFCQCCLETWLERQQTSSTCPECRAEVTSDDVRPIRALRSLISSLTVHCDNNERGCRQVLKLENETIHLTTCEFQPITCAGCGDHVIRKDLVDHHLSCDRVRAAIYKSPSSLRRHVSYASDREWRCLGNVEARVLTLEQQLKTLREDLDAAEIVNRRLEDELRKTRNELLESSVAKICADCLGAEIHSLLETAEACNWFSSSQKSDLFTQLQRLK